MKKVLKAIGIFLLILVLLIAAFFAFLTITQLDPKSEGANVNLMLDRAVSDRTFSAGDEISVLSWNIGYSALGKESDFFMDGETFSVCRPLRCRREASGRPPVRPSTASGRRSVP